MQYRTIIIAAYLLPVSAVGQSPTVTVADYARAESKLGSYLSPLLSGARVSPTWLDGDRFWYQNSIPDGSEFVLVDPESATRTRAFDQERLARGLSARADTNYSALALPFQSFSYLDNGRSIAFDVRSNSYVCSLRDYTCAAGSNRPDRTDRNEVISPDGEKAAFIRDYNLWVRDIGTGQERQLTTDGVQYFGYATNNAGWVHSDRPVLLWSPDSRKIATFQHDERGVGDMFLVTTNVGHPTLESWRYPLPEDSVIFRISRVVVHLDGPRVVRLQMAPDQHRSTICDHVACRGTWADVEWSPDGTQLAFVSSSRDHKRAQLRIANPETGAVRDVMQEVADTFYESGYNMVNWHVLNASNEVLWYSQRSDWGHLYMYDLSSGQLKHQITQGNWNVLQLLRVDPDGRKLYFIGSGREPGDPYFEYFYSINMDGSRLALLTPDSANHEITLSPSGRYFIDRFSTPVDPPTTVLRNLDGESVLRLEATDAVDLTAAGWVPPMPFTVKARDGVTDLYGLMYRPSNFDPSHSYPVVNYLYPGPQTGSVGSRSFNPARGDKQAIAELGFIVVEVDALGTPKRSKTFHAAYYGNMGDNGIPDQIAMIQQLGERYSYMDLDRVGIYGHSGGGFASTAAIMQYPEFYKVAVSQAGNHDNRNYEDDWGEKWQGLLEDLGDGKTNYDNQANQLQADNLKGKLLLAHGTMDNNVPPYNTLLVVDALIEANKDFDLVLLPNRRHGFGNEPYMMRRRWDYFVRNLLGAEPPAEYEFGNLPRPNLIP